MSVTQVPTVRLGKSGLEISKIVLGMMSYGSSKWQPWVLEGDDACREHVKRALEHGIFTFDTADVYSNGLSETILGRVLKDLKVKREDVVILTKCFMPVQDDPSIPIGAPKKPNQGGLSRKHIFEAIKASLKRLDMDYVDVLQCHRFDKNTPIEETMQALHDVVQAGYARKEHHSLTSYIGMSSCYAYQFALMQNYAINNRLTPFISMQNFYNAVYREEEREMLPLLQELGVGCIPWSPLGRGFLARPASDKSSSRAQGDRHLTGIVGSEAEASIAINEAVERLAKKKGVSMAQISLAWLLHKPNVAPIVGSTKLENIEDLVSAVNVKLGEEEIKEIEDPYVPRAVSGLLS